MKKKAANISDPLKPTPKIKKAVNTKKIVKGPTVYAPSCPEPIGRCILNNNGKCCYYCENKNRCSLGPCHKIPSKCGLLKGGK